MTFKRDTLQQIIDRAISDFEFELPNGDVRIKGSTTFATALMHAKGTHTVYGYLDYIAKQILPSTADEEFLVIHGDVRNVTRKKHAKAKGSVQFTGTNGSTIIIGTVIQRSDGEQFSTDSQVTISGGEATVSVTALLGGTSGNTSSGSILSLTSTIAGVNSGSTVQSGDIAAGADVENLELWRGRIVARWRNPVLYGKTEDYVEWALEVPGVTRAWCIPQRSGLGTVGLTFVNDDGTVSSSIIPNSAKVTEVQDYINNVQPADTIVTVYTPVAVTLSPTISLTPNTTTVQSAVQAELKDLILRKGAPSSTLYLAEINEAISVSPGETNHVLTVIVADQVYTDAQIPVLGGITWL